MKYLKTTNIVTLAAALLMLLPLAASADGSQSLRLSEVCLGDSSTRGKAWIEIQNISYGSQNLGGFYITNNPAALNPELSAPQRIEMMHLIPTGNPVTRITPQNCLLLYADGQDNLGLQHLDFTLAPGDIVALYSGNGVDLLDSLTIPDYLMAGKSWAKDFKKDSWRICDRPTPTQANDYLQAKKNNKIAEFKEKDPYGFAMAIMAMGVVFSCLLLLYLFFKLFGKVFARIGNKDVQIAPLATTGTAGNGTGTDTEAAVAAMMALTEATSGTGNEDMDVALIALALEAELAHEEESGIITIIPTQSPWADKAEMIAAGTLR